MTQAMTSIAMANAILDEMATKGTKATTKKATTKKATTKKATTRKATTRKATTRKATTRKAKGTGGSTTVTAQASVAENNAQVLANIAAINAPKARILPYVDEQTRKLMDKFVLEQQALYKEYIAKKPLNKADLDKYAANVKAVVSRLEMGSIVRRLWPSDKPDSFKELFVVLAHDNQKGVRRVRYGVCVQDKPVAPVVAEKQPSYANGIEAQTAFCKSHKVPHFAPADGKCFKCYRNIYEKISVENQRLTVGLSVLVGAKNRSEGSVFYYAELSAIRAEEEHHA